MRITKAIQKLEAYVPGEQPTAKNVVKLNTNENPYPPSPKCAEVLKSFDLDKLRRYPDPVFKELRAALAKLNGTIPERIFVGNGSDEILSLVAKAFVENDEKIASLDPSYSLYKTLAAIRDVKWVAIGPDLTKAKPNAKVALALITNPNAPTGTLKEKAEIAAFAQRFKGVVLVDEAYADFAPTNCMSLATAATNKNIIVMRTFSKSYSLAGLRVGYCVGPVDLIDALYKIKDSYNVDAIAQAVALAALNDRHYFTSIVSKVIKSRGTLSQALRIRGWDVPESSANFIFARPPKPFTAEEIFTKLRQMKVYVRYFKGALTGDRLRITVGTSRDIVSLCKALDQITRESKK